MRKYLLAACAVTCILGALPPASAESFDAQDRSVGTANPKIAALLTEFPAGGPWLRAAIARAVEADPSLTADAIFVANSANTYQRQAIRLGLADAANSFANIGSAGLNAERQIRTALGPGDPDARAGVGLLPELAQGVPGFSKAGAATTGCVSPSRPGC
jgi:hypothetical protein